MLAKNERPTSSNSSRSSGRECWICFDKEEDDPNQEWAMPCKCKGTTKWVHQRCLLMWIDLKAKVTRNAKITCPQCKMEYSLSYPPSGFLVGVLDSVDLAVFHLCPFLAGGFFVMLVYWSAVCYSVVVMNQVIGPDAVRQLLEDSSPSVLLVALPFLPVFLVGFAVLKWEERTLLLLRKFGPRLPVLRNLLPAPVIDSFTPGTPEVGEETSGTRIVFTALIAPGLATLAGNFIFGDRVANPINRALLGFLVVNLASGVILMYRKQMLYKKLKRRRVMEYRASSEDLPAGTI